MDADDGGNQEQATNNSVDDMEPACRPDGLRVAFSRFITAPSAVVDIFEKNLETGAEVNLTQDVGISVGPIAT
jgi:hypothetical protein